MTGSSPGLSDRMLCSACACIQELATARWPTSTYKTRPCADRSTRVVLKNNYVRPLAAATRSVNRPTPGSNDAAPGESKEQIGTIQTRTLCTSPRGEGNYYIHLERGHICLSHTSRCLTKLVRITAWGTEKSRGQCLNIHLLQLRSGPCLPGFRGEFNGHLHFTDLEAKF